MPPLTDLLWEIFELTMEIIFVGFVFFGIEKLRPAEKESRFFKDDFRQELGMAILSIVILAPIYIAAISGLAHFALEPFIPYQMFNDTIAELPLVVQIFLGAFILDFSVYWRHRFTHNYMWNFHAIHHSAKQISWLTSMRLHPIDTLISILFNVIILYILGFSTIGMAFSVIMLKIFNYFTHANIDLQFGKPMRYIFASPNFHRWHHAEEKEAHNKNYCSTFSLLDVIFGTYYHPEGLPKSTGLGNDQKRYPDTLWGQILYPLRKKTDTTTKDTNLHR